MTASISRIRKSRPAPWRPTHRRAAGHRESAGRPSRNRLTNVVFHAAIDRRSVARDGSRSPRRPTRSGGRGDASPGRTGGSRCRRRSWAGRWCPGSAASWCTAGSDSQSWRVGGSPVRSSRGGRRRRMPERRLDDLPLIAHPGAAMHDPGSSHCVRRPPVRVTPGERRERGWRHRPRLAARRDGMRRGRRSGCPVPLGGRRD